MVTYNALISDCYKGYVAQQGQRPCADVLALRAVRHAGESMHARPDRVGSGDHRRGRVPDSRFYGGPGPRRDGKVDFWFVPTQH